MRWLDFLILFIKTQKKTIIGIAIVCGLILGGLYCPICQQGLMEISAPAIKGLNQISRKLSRLKQEYLELHQVKLENLRLKKEIERLKMQLLWYQDLQKRISILESLLKFKRSIHYPIIGARIIGHAPSFLEPLIFIDQGSRQGVKVGYPVVGSDGVVGVVVSVSPNYAKVLLATSGDCRIAVVCQRTRVQGVFVGDGLNKGEIYYVKNREDIVKGDLFMTSGMDGVFPRGIPVGRVISVNKTSGIFQEIMVRTTTDFTKIENVLVIKGVPKLPFRQ